MYYGVQFWDANQMESAWIYPGQLVSSQHQLARTKLVLAKTSICPGVPVSGAMGTRAQGSRATQHLRH